MQISDSFLKSHLENVFWIGGGACGGKTTITDLLAQRHGLVAYHQEDVLAEHRQAASPEDHPALCAPFRGWEWFFGRPLDEYTQALLDADREYFEMVVLEAVRQSVHAVLVMDGFLLDDPLLALRLSDYHRSVFLFADEEVIRDGFFDRADKQDLAAVINALHDPERAREHVLSVVCALTAQQRAKAEAACVKVLVRSRETGLSAMVAAVEEHFGLASG